MANGTDITVNILGDAQKLQRSLQQASTDLKAFKATADAAEPRGFGASVASGLDTIHSKLESLTSKMNTYGRRLTVGLTLPIAGAFYEIVKQGEAAEKTLNQTDAVIKSTGQSAGVTAKQVQSLSDAIAMKTGIDHLQIQSSANMLLTFRDIRNEAGKGNDIFNQSVKAVTDVSVAMKEDGKTAAIQLGKALNDPILGLTSLRRVGVQFTQQQQDEIKSLVAVGDKLGAQKIILGEVTAEFGGSAAAQATALDRLKQHVDILAEKLSKILLPIIDQWSQKFLNLLDTFTRLDPKFQEFALAIAVIAAAAGPLLRVGSALGTIAQGGVSVASFFVANPVVVLVLAFAAAVAEVALNWKKVWDFISSHKLLALIIGLINPVVAVIVGLGLAIGYIASHWDETVATVKGILNDLQGDVGTARDWIVQAWHDVSASVLGVWHDFESFLGDVHDLLDNFNGILGAVADVLNDVVIPAVSLFGQIVYDVISAAVDVISFMWGIVQPIFQTFALIVGAVLVGAFEVMWNLVQPILQALWDFIQDQLVPAFNFLMSTAQIVWGAVATAVSYAWNNIISPALEAFKSFVEGPLSSAWSTFSGAASTAWDAVKGAIQGALHWIGSHAADFLQVMGDVAGAIGLSPVANALHTAAASAQNWGKAEQGGVMTAGGLQTFANGGVFSALGLPVLGMDNQGFITNRPTAIVGEGGAYDEFVIPTDPKYRKRAIDLFAELGTRLMASGGDIQPSPYGPSLSQQAGVDQKPYGGVANTLWDAVAGAFGGAASWIVDKWHDVESFVRNMAADGLDALLPGPWATSGLDLGRGVANKIREAVIGLVRGQAQKVIDSKPKPKPSGGTFMPGSAPPPPGSVTDWLEQAIAITGVDQSWLAPLYAIAMRESGGDPNAVNNWDINAQMGIPSEGMMQTIPPVFAAYGPPGGNIFNPVDDAVAAIRYILARYGSIWNTPANYYAQGGTLVADDGQVTLAPGMNRVFNGTGSPEPLSAGPNARDINVIVYATGDGDDIAAKVREVLEDIFGGGPSIAGGSRR